jgi:D-aminoacyl-tRNA deacylase
MIGIIYSALDEASSNMAMHLAKEHDFEEIEVLGPKVFAGDGVRMYETRSQLIHAEFVDSLGLETAYFLSKHESEAHVPAFTTHSLGNWGPEAQFGGRPMELSYAAPVAMLAVLSNLTRAGGVAARTYEATHHGPLLRTPSLFVEIGGTPEIIRSVECAARAAEAAYSAFAEQLSKESSFSKIAVGIGGGHYAEAFSRLATEKGYAFSHIMPKYAIAKEGASTDFKMLEQCMVRTTHEPEVAVMDWKGLGAAARNEAIKKLNELGIDYERV